jgi:hypothetical protein
MGRQLRVQGVMYALLRGLSAAPRCPDQRRTETDDPRAQEA